MEYLARIDWMFVMMAGVFLIMLGVIGLLYRSSEESTSRDESLFEIAKRLISKFDELEEEVKDVKKKLKKDGMITRKHLELNHKDTIKRIKKI